MFIPHIEMHSQMGKIEMTHTSAKQEIKQKHADMSIKQPHANMTIQTTPSRLTIDQTKAWEDMDLMSILKRSKKFAQDGLKASLQGTAKRAEQGREMMEIEHEGQPLISQAVTNSERKQKDINITFIPSPFAVKTEYEPSQVQIQIDTNKPSINVSRSHPEHHYVPGEVHIDMAQKPYLKINVPE